MRFIPVPSLIMFLALGFQSAGLAEPTGPASKAPAAEQAAAQPSAAEPIATRQTLFAIPFTIDRPTQPSEEPSQVQLYVSTDRGATWRLYNRVEPSQGQFLFRAGADGPYWFQVRTLDQSGRIRPQPAGVRLLRVVVDTTRPNMELSAQRAEAGQIVARWKIDEPHPNPASLAIHYRTGPRQPWQPVAIGQQKRNVSGTVETNEVTLWPKAAGEVQIRAEVADAAGNRTVCHAQAATAQTTGQKPAKNTQESDSSWNAGKRQAATSWPAKDTPSANQLAGNQAKGGANSVSRKRKLVPTVEQLKPDATIGPVAGKVNPPIQKQYVAPNSKPTPRTGAALPPGERPKMINKRLFELDYDNDMSSQGVSRIELWGSQDGGRSWRSYALDDDNRSPLLVSVDAEGIYGFRVVASSGANARANPPSPGTLPEVFIGVDLTKPTARITDVKNGAGAESGKLSIAWEATDRFLAARPVSLSFSQHRSGPWTPIASGLENTGRYEWTLDGRVPKSIYMRLEVRDAAGNIVSQETAEPVTLEPTRPMVRIRGVRPLGQDYRNAARQHPFR